MSGSDSAPKSKFARAKPSLANEKTSGQKSSTNTYTLTYPTILKLNVKSNRGQWCVVDVIYDPGKRFDPELVTPGKGKATYHPKPKYLCWISVANKEDLNRTYFAYAMYLKDDTFRTLTWVQEKRMLGHLSYRNGIRIIHDKSGLETDRVRAYGNRLPRVGVLAGADQKLHHVGFLSDRHAIKELELNGYEDIQAVDELLYGENKPYIPKYLAGLTIGVEEENDEIDVADDESQDEEEQEDDDSKDDESEKENADDDDESAEQGPFHVNKESLTINRIMRGSSKFEEIRNVVSKTDVLARMEQLDAADSGHDVVDKGQNTDMSKASNAKKSVPQLVKKRKNENTTQSSPKKQKSTPVPSKTKKSTSPPKTKQPDTPKTKKPDTPKKSSRRSASPKRKPEPKPASKPSKASASKYVKHYTTADKIAEGHAKVMANDKALLAFTDPGRAAVLNEEVRMIDLLKGKVDPDTINIVVPFIYELFCKHYNLPVPDPRATHTGSDQLHELGDQLGECSSWQEAIHIANAILDAAKKEKTNESQTMALISLIDAAVQNPDGDVMHSVVMCSTATIKVGVAALGSDVEEEYLESLKNIELQKTLFNLYSAFLAYVKPAEDEPENPPEEEFSMF